LVTTKWLSTSELAKRVQGADAIGDPAGAGDPHHQARTIGHGRPIPASTAESDCDPRIVK
jgi:hypothetical protein